MTQEQWRAVDDYTCDLLVRPDADGLLITPRGQTNAR